MVTCPQAPQWIWQVLRGGTRSSDLRDSWHQQQSLLKYENCYGGLLGSFHIPASITSSPLLHPEKFTSSGYTIFYALIWPSLRSRSFPLHWENLPYIHPPVCAKVSGIYNLMLSQRSPTFLAPGTGFMEENCSMDGGEGEGGWGMVSGWFKCITFIVHFISIIITPAPPQIIRH